MPLKSLFASAVLIFAIVMLSTALILNLPVSYKASSTTIGLALHTWLALLGINIILILLLGYFHFKSEHGWEKMQ